MRKVWAVAVLLGLSVGHPAVASEDAYGAIAYSPAADNTAAATDKATKDEALDAALKICREETKSNPDSCRPALYFVNACGALASASNGSWGSGWGQTQDIAKSWAISVCAQYGGKDCKLKVVICSPGGAGYIPAD